MKFMTVITKIGMICFVTIYALSALVCAQATSIPTSRQIIPEELVKMLQSSGKEKPLLIHVGSHVLYAQAHIPGSEYIGPASDAAALQRLRARLESLPRNKFIV